LQPHALDANAGADVLPQSFEIVFRQNLTCLVAERPAPQARSGSLDRGVETERAQHAHGISLDRDPAAFGTPSGAAFHQLDGEAPVAERARQREPGDPNPRQSGPCRFPACSPPKGYRSWDAPRAEVGRLHKREAWTHGNKGLDERELVR
jgi:hypothetical protein